MSSISDYTNEDDFRGAYYDELTKVFAKLQVEIILSKPTQNDNDLSKPPGPTHSGNISVENCPLHNWLAKGGLGYSPRVDGTYSMYAPKCSDCDYGVSEKKEMLTKVNLEKETTDKFKSDWIKIFGRLPVGVE
jgi:hypothetical protein